LQRHWSPAISLADPSKIRAALARWYRREARDLPWRRTRDPYRIWVSEIILQQTRVDQGLPYYERFIATFPTVESLATAPLDKVLKAWEGLGYYTRARNMHAAAQRVVRDYGGRMPERAELLQLLPGIGRYTAAAIASSAFDEQVASVDTNIMRVLARLFRIEGCIDDVPVQREVWALAESLVPRKGAGDYNQAVMELGATICVARGPACDLCPVSAWCEARQAGLQDVIPLRRKKAPPAKREMVSAAIRRGDAYLLVRRPDSGLLGGLWEFPAFELDAASAPGRYLEQCCMEALGVSVKAGGVVSVVQHAYTHFKLTMTVYACRYVGGEPAPQTHTQWAWVRKEALSEYALHKAQQKVLAAL
jgi:A/G-specific adenine glycosylase